jgi:hypothetical protein
MTAWRVTWKINLSARARTQKADPDLSWADEEILDKLDRGIYVNVSFAVRVLYHGREVGRDYLSNSVYENVASFRDHIGSRGKWSSYFTDMVHTAIREARAELCNVPRLRCA